MNSPSSHRLRKGRVSITGQLYLLTATTIERQPVFHDLWLARITIGQMRLAQEAQQVRSLAWVLMPDHLHWLIELRQTTLERVMRQLKYRSTHLINCARGGKARSGKEGFMIGHCVGKRMFRL